MRILMIEDDPKLCASVKYQLEMNGFTVDCSFDGDDGWFLLREHIYDLVLLDRMLPGSDGIAILRRARNAGITIPIIMLTALGELADRVQGLDLGADDYIVKPFAFEELLARIHSALRRPRTWAQQKSQIEYGDVSYDTIQKLLIKGDEQCTLSRREGDLMELFLRNPGQILPRTAILAKVWGPETEIEDGNLDNYIYFLRRRLRTLRSRLSIKAVRGVGYRLEDNTDF